MVRFLQFLREEQRKTVQSGRASTLVPVRCQIQMGQGCSSELMSNLNTVVLPIAVALSIKTNELHLISGKPLALIPQCATFCDMLAAGVQFVYQYYSVFQAPTASSKTIPSPRGNHGRHISGKRYCPISS